MKKLHSVPKKLISFILVLSIVLGMGTSSMFAAVQNITSMVVTQGPIVDVGVTGGCGFTFPTFNGGAVYDDIAADLALFVKQNNVWVSIDNNASSGWIYNSNFGHFWDGGGGYWFSPVTETTYIRLASKSNPNVYLDYTLRVTPVVRNTYNVTSFDGTTTFTAGNDGAIGFPLPRIDGGIAVSNEIDKFVYQIKKNGVWVNLYDSSLSSFTYAPNGYNNLSAADQWGYWVDSIYGLWFKPIQVNMEIRIGYPTNGVKGADCGNNYVYYTFIGNPSAPRPDPVILADIPVGTSSNSYINGWNMVWNDEFSGTQLDTTKWNYVTGYYMSNDPNSWGWGNAELEHYTNSTNNVFVQNGVLTLRGLQDPMTFPQDPNRVAPYSSGKISTQNKFTFKYGRIDFSAKLPLGNGMWPALWMLPQNNTYGNWALSGEIDVMESKGRVPGASSGAIHFGDTWPGNKYIGGEYQFPSGQTTASDFHVYSVIWEADMIKWYVDGHCFYFATKEQWYTNAALDNPYAPFDQEFYIIMNLAIGGYFDGLTEPTPADFPANMQVDYVRVYKPGTAVVIPVTGVTLSQTSATLTSSGQTVALTPTIAPADATNKGVTWTSSNTSVATVDANGVVTAKANGTATITVTTTDGNKTAACAVTVSLPVSVTGVTLNQTTATLTSAGQTLTLTPTVAPSNATNKTVTWTSSNTSVATVSTSGVVTAKANGTATITVKTNDGSKTATCAVTVSIPVNVPVTGVTLNQTTATLTAVNQTLSLTPTVAPSNATNKTVTWTSSNTAVATVSTSGVVTAKANGTATITVKTNDGSKTATCAVTVNIPVNVPVTGVTLNQTTATLTTAGQTLSLTPTVAPSNATNKTVTWTSSNTAVATVSTAGVVTAVANGTATITVKTNDGAKTATCAVTVNIPVNVPVTGVTLNQTTATLTTAGQTLSLTPTVAPSNATNKAVTWTSSNTAVATVSSSGVVTAVANGTATITVKTNDGAKTATCAVTVNIPTGVIEAESYTAMSGIATEACTEGGLNVGWTEAGDWMDYTVTVPQTGKYTVQYRVAGTGTGEIQLRSGATTLATTSIPASGGWQTWSTVQQTDVVLQAGTQTLRLYVGAGGFNLNWFKLTYTAPTSIQVEAESYSTMSGIQTEACTEGGLNVGWTEAGDWMDYTVNVPTAGQYTVDYRVAGNGGQIQMQVGGVTKGTTTIPSTGGWQTWSTVQQTNVTLAAGTQTIRVYVGQGGFNINWFKLTYTGSTPVTGKGLNISGTSLNFYASDVPQSASGVIVFYQIYNTQAEAQTRAAQTVNPDGIPGYNLAYSGSSWSLTRTDASATSGKYILYKFNVVGVGLTDWVIVKVN